MNQHDKLCQVANVYLVGGAVRDRVMGQEPKDEDYVVVGSSIDEMDDLDFGLVGVGFPVFIGQNGCEYALARSEKSIGMGYSSYEVDASPKVTLEEDLHRRDFTMNAMAMSTDGVIIDPYNGQRDIENKVIRLVNSDAFHEDPVRVIRACRFAARYGFSLHKDVINSIAECIRQGRMQHLTKERVWKEFEKALDDRKFAEFIGWMQRVGALTQLGIDFNRKIEGFIEFYRQAPDSGTSGKERDKLLSMVSFLMLLEKSEYNRFLTKVKISHNYKFGANLMRNYGIMLMCPRADFMVRFLTDCRVQTTPTFFDLALDYLDALNTNVAVLIKSKTAYFKVKAAQFPELENRDLGNAIREARIEAVQAVFELCKDRAFTHVIVK